MLQLMVVCAVIETLLPLVSLQHRGDDRADLVQISVWLSVMVLVPFRWSLEPEMQRHLGA